MEMYSAPGPLGLWTEADDVALFPSGQGPLILSVPLPSLESRKMIMESKTVSTSEIFCE